MSDLLAAMRYHGRMENERKTLAIVGGGAAGLAAAIAAARELHARRRAGEADAVPVDVVVYESDERVGRSVLATGNGRCNFSNARIAANLYHNGEFVSHALLELLRRHEESRGGASACSLEMHPVGEFFADLGLVWREDGGGRLYPFANKASSVLDVLRSAGGRLGIREACDSTVTNITLPTHEGERFHLRLVGGAVEHAQAVIVACGGHARGEVLPAAYAPGPGRPVLGPLRTVEAVVKRLDSIRVRSSLALIGPDGREKAKEEGELLFRSYGVSGIAVFNLSRFAREGDALLVDFLPFEHEGERFLLARHARMAADGLSFSCEDFLRGLLLPQVARAVIEQAGLRPSSSFGREDVSPLAAALKSFRLTVAGIGDPRQCQVTRGGYEVALFDPRTMESRRDPGLYAVGEALDVDGPCGGYNLHWAWTSGILAGCAAAERLAHA